MTVTEPGGTGPPERKSRPPGRTGGAAEAETLGGGIDVPDSTPSAPCWVGTPGRTRRLFAVVVVRCPICRGLHTHRAGAVRLFGGTAVRTCPETGRTYVLAPTARTGVVS